MGSRTSNQSANGGNAEHDPIHYGRRVVVVNSGLALQNYYVPV